jgi:hypothetical protein
MCPLPKCKESNCAGCVVKSNATAIEFDTERVLIDFPCTVQQVLIFLVKDEVTEVVVPVCPGRTVIVAAGE